MNRRTLTLFVCLASLAVAILAFAPAPVQGVWTGKIVGCMCDSHNFLLIESGRVTLCKGKHTDIAAWYPLARQNATTWRWDHVDILPQKNGRLGYSTNTYLLRPHLCWMHVTATTGDSERFVMWRDPKAKDARAILAALPPPQSLDESYRRIERLEDNRKQETVQHPGGG